ncbi:MAG: hypothetical protein MUC87_14280 [Bacteroidia bacterium]|jgi:hypothetical protein|nr:hypothetical protein [Bacteroidia bacterium]
MSNFFLEYQNHIIGLFITIAGGIIIWWIQKDKLKLVYDISASVQFPSGSKKGRFFNITFKNTGNKPITNCDIDISFESSAIDSYAFSNIKLVSNINKSENSISGQIPLLNPKESLLLTITTKEDKGLNNPSVSARAIGVTATRVSSNSRSFIDKLIILLLFVATLVMAITTLKIKVQQKNEPQQEDRIFILFNINGIGNDYPVFISSYEKTYKDAGLFLFYKYVSLKKDNEKYLNSLIALAECDEDMSNNSRAFIYYLIAKIKGYEGKKPEAIQFLDKSKESREDLYQLLIENDSSFNVQKIRAALIKNKFFQNNQYNQTYIDSLEVPFKDE